MTQTTPVPVAEILHSSSARLARIRASGMRFAHISHLVKQSLPDSLAPFCAGALVRHETLVVFVYSAAWGARIRFQQAAMLSAVQGSRSGAHARGIRIKVLLPEHDPTTAPSTARRELSDTARRSLRTAANCIRDERLAAALRRLARQ